MEGVSYLTKDLPDLVCWNGKPHVVCGIVMPTGADKAGRSWGTHKLHKEGKNVPRACERPAF